MSVTTFLSAAALLTCGIYLTMILTGFPYLSAEPSSRRKSSRTGRRSSLSTKPPTGQTGITKRNWLSDKPLVEWFGVTADNNGRVTALSLNDNRLSGIIPPELGNLSNLDTLSLGNNQLSGCLPAGLRNVSNNDLHLLDLTFCEREPSEVPSDREVLVALYEATAGPNWTNNTNWLSDEPLSNWHRRNHQRLWKGYRLVP